MLIILANRIDTPIVTAVRLKILERIPSLVIVGQLIFAHIEDSIGRVGEAR